MSSAPMASRALRSCSRAWSRGPMKAPAQASRYVQLSRAATLASRVYAFSTPGPRYLSTSARALGGLMPDTPDPQPPDTQDSHRAAHPVEVTEEEYHQKADEFMESVYEKAEKIQEARSDVEVEYSSGVLSITFPPNGTYVLNKQPPNKQIWLSSPISGPKRYDWVLADESMHHKEGGGTGDWIYLRDHTSLSSVLSKELGIDVGIHEENLEVSKDPTE